MTPPTQFMHALLCSLQPGVRWLAGGAARLTPFTLQKSALQLILNTLLKQPLDDGDFEFLSNRVLAVDISDLRIEYRFGYRDSQLVLVDYLDSADVTIRGHSDALLQLINREQDPDTLFFQRRLIIEGDTELGLHVKNLLDAIDDDDLPNFYTQIVRVVARFRHWLDTAPQAVA